MPKFKFFLPTNDFKKSRYIQLGVLLKIAHLLGVAILLKTDYTVLINDLFLEKDLYKLFA